LRVIDTSFLQQLPCFLVRDGTILVNIEQFRAIIKHDRVFLFIQQGNEEELKEFCRFLQYRITRDSSTPSATTGSYLPYEFKVIDAILTIVSESLYQSHLHLKLRIDRVLEDVHLQDSDKGLKALMGLNKELNTFQKRVGEVHSALNQVLNSDEDLAAMYLTVQFTTGHRRRIDQHEEAEMMFENYLAQIEDIGNEVSELQNSIDVTQEHVKISLDTQRNQIMRMNLVLTLGTFSTGCAGLISGAFGMNLTNYFEYAPYAFFIATGSMGVSMTAIFSAAYLYCKTRRML